MEFSFWVSYSIDKRAVLLPEQKSSTFIRDRKGREPAMLLFFFFFFWFLFFCLMCDRNFPLWSSCLKRTIWHWNDCFSTEALHFHFQTKDKILGKINECFVWIHSKPLLFYIIGILHISLSNNMNGTLKSVRNLLRRMNFALHPDLNCVVAGDWKLFQKILQGRDLFNFRIPR